MGKIKKRMSEAINQDVFLSRLDPKQQSNSQRQAKVGPQTKTQASGITPHPDGTITVQGVKIGPFVGEWQGVMRNEIIAERLVELTDGDKQNTDIQIKGDGVRIIMGDVEFGISSADA